jgi:hypothetical protein
VFKKYIITSKAKKVSALETFSVQDAMKEKGAASVLKFPLEYATKKTNENREALVLSITYQILSKMIILK